MASTRSGDYLIAVAAVETYATMLLPLTEIRLPDTHRLIPSSSSTVRKIRSLALNDLRKSKRALALHFRPARYHWSSRKVGGMATPVARTACEACAVS